MLAVLPNVLSCDVVGRWIDLKSLVRLDSAHCNHAERQSFETLLASKELVFDCPVSFGNRQIISWLAKKELKVSSIEFSADYIAQPSSDYLRKWGSFVKMVEIQFGQQMHKMYIVAIHCRNLRIVRCENVTLDQAFNELLWCNPNIAEIWFEKVQSSSNTAFSQFFLSKLHTLSINNCVYESIVPLPITYTCDALQKLHLGSAVNAEVILKVVRLCPALKSLSLRGAQLLNKTIIEICTVRPTLLHLDLSGNLILNSDGVLAMCMKLTCLRSISIRDCARVCDASIRILATHCGDTLEAIYMDVKCANDIHTVGRLNYFSEHCPKLRFLSIGLIKYVLCAKGGTFALLHDLPSLRTLVVESESIISHSSRQFLSVLKPQLQIVVEDPEKHTYNALSMPL